MEVHERLERLRRRAELEQRLQSRQPGQLRLDDAVGMGTVDRGGAVDPGGAETSRSRFWPEPVPSADPSTAIPSLPATVLSTPLLPVPMPVSQLPLVTGAAADSEARVAEPASVPSPEDTSAKDPECLGESAFPEAKPVAPDPLAPMVYDMLAALRPVLRRYPGLMVAVWPADHSAEDLSAAVRFTVDSSTGLSLRMPRSPGGEPPAGARDSGPGEVSDGLAGGADRDGTVPGFGVCGPELAVSGVQDPAASVPEEVSGPAASGTTTVGAQVREVVSPDIVSPGIVPPDVVGADPDAADPDATEDGDQVVNWPGAQPGEGRPVPPEPVLPEPVLPEPVPPRSVAAELARLLRESGLGSVG